MAGARISREKSWSGWLGREFFKKKLSLDRWGEQFSGKSLVWMAGAVCSSRKKLEWMAGERNSREKAWYGWLGRVFLEKKLSLDGWGPYFLRKGLVWMAGACISREKAESGWLGAVFLEKKLSLDGWGACFSRKS